MSGFWWGWQASVRRSCAQNSELRLPPLPMWLRQPGRGRRVAGTAALRSQSEARVALGSSPPTGLHPEGSQGGSQQWAGGSATTTTEDPASLAGGLVPAFLAQIGQRAGVYPHLNWREPSQRQGQHSPPPWLQEAAGAGGRGQIIQEGLSKYELQSSHLGALFQVHSHQVPLSHWHTRAQRTRLSHTGTAHPHTTLLPKSGTHWSPHTKMLVFTQTPRDTATPEHIGLRNTLVGEDRHTWLDNNMP